MKTFFDLAIDFVIWTFAAYFWLAITIAFYEDQRRSRLETLTEQEKNENGSAAGFVALCSALLVAFVHLVMQWAQHQAK
jgi:hypothetical protein